MARGPEMSKKPTMLERQKFDDVGIEAPITQIMEFTLSSNRVELFPTERIIKLDIPFSELFHRCTEAEWNDFIGFLSTNGVRHKKTWWKWW